MADYPSAIKTFTEKQDGVDTILAEHINSPQSEIEAIETELGTNPKGSAADLKTRLAVKLTDAGTIKHYDSGWFLVAIGTKYGLTHSLGTTAALFRLYWASDSSGTGMQEVTSDWTGSGVAHGSIMKEITTTTLSVQTGSVATNRTIDDSGNPTNQFAGYLRVIGLGLAA